MILHLLCFASCGPCPQASSDEDADEDDDGGWHRPIIIRCCTFQARPTSSSSSSSQRRSNLHPSGISGAYLLRSIQPANQQPPNSEKQLGKTLITHAASRPPQSTRPLSDDPKDVARGALPRAKKVMESWWWRSVATISIVSLCFFFRDIKKMLAVSGKMTKW